jgi:hypothetical protein
MGMFNVPTCEGSFQLPHVLPFTRYRKAPKRARLLWPFWSPPEPLYLPTPY